MALKEAIRDTQELAKGLGVLRDEQAAINEQLERGEQIINRVLAIPAPPVPTFAREPQTVFAGNFGQNVTSNDRGTTGITSNDRLTAGVRTSNDRATAGVLAAIGKLQTSIDRVGTGVLFAIRNG